MFGVWFRLDASVLLLSEWLRWTEEKPHSYRLFPVMQSVCYAWWLGNSFSTATTYTSFCRLFKSFMYYTVISFRHSVPHFALPTNYISTWACGKLIITVINILKVLLLLYFLLLFLRFLIKEGEQIYFYFLTN